VALYLVTGGAGFIGSHLVSGLVRRGERVRVLDDFSSSRRGDNLRDLADDIELIDGSVRDEGIVASAMRRVDFVLHQAARTSVPKSVNDPVRTNEVNVGGTLTLLLAARDAKVRRFVFASSSSVYGETQVLPKHEELPTQPISPYGVSKLAAEQYGLAFHRAYELPFVALRYFNVFGPRQDPNSEYAAVIPKFIAALSDGGKPVIYGDGTQSRDFTYVADIVAVNLLACEREAAVGRVINVAGGERHTLLELYAILGELLGNAHEPEFRPARPGEIKHSEADITLARELLGYRPTVGWREGLERTVEWFRTMQSPVAGRLGAG